MYAEKGDEHPKLSYNVASRTFVCRKVDDDRTVRVPHCFEIGSGQEPLLLVCLRQTLSAGVDDLSCHQDYSSPHMLTIGQAASSERERELWQYALQLRRDPIVFQGAPFPRAEKGSQWMMSTILLYNDALRCCRQDSAQQHLRYVRRLVQPSRPPSQPEWY